MNLDVGFCFYEDSLDTVKRAIESVKEHVRYVFAIDGKFEFLESENELSSDDVRQYLKSIPNVIMESHPNLKENEKRQKYIELCKKHWTDILLIMDSDEWVSDRTNWEEAYKFLETYHSAEDTKPTIRSVNIQNPGSEGNFPRIWIRPYLIEYTETHNFWRMSDGTIWKSTANYPPVSALYMRQNDKLRSDWMVATTVAYQEKLIKYEKPFKKKYRSYAKG